MAITTVLQPNSLCFAGNPIVVKATTDKYLDEDESMLRIILSATFNEKYSGGDDRGVYSFTTELSQPVSDGGTAVFNLSDAAQTIVRRIVAEIDMNSESWKNSVGVSCDFHCKDVWVKDGYEQGGDSSQVYSFDIIPGMLTDFEMMNESNIDLESKMPCVLSRMPVDDRMIYKGETLVIPSLSEGGTVDDTIRIGEDLIAVGMAFLDSHMLDYRSVSINHNADGEFVFNSSLTGPITGYYRTNTNGVHFLRFINGFGAVENISVRAKDKLTYEVSGETHSLVQEISTRPTDRRYATKSQPVGVYELSSGYVPQRWAEWYVQELLTSPRVWILLGGKWVPALIEAEDDCVIYDRTKPEMPHVDFTLRLAIDGVTGITW